MNYLRTAILMIVFFSSKLIAGELTILNIASYHPDTSWTSDCVEGIETALGSKYRLEHHYMDTKRIPVTRFQEAADSARDKFKRVNPDLVMLGDDNALKLMGPMVAETGVPVIHYGVNNNPRVYFKGAIPENVYGVLERPLISPMVRYLETIIPGLRKILILFDDSVSSKAVISAALYGKQSLSFPNGTIARVRVTDDWDIWQSIVAGSGKEYQAIMIVNHFTVKDAKGNTIDDRIVIRRSVQLSPVPVLATNDFAVHAEGAVGAMVIVGQEHGQLAGKMAEDLLSGKSDMKKHILQRAGTFYFNRAQLKRFHLELPPAIESAAVFQ